MGEYRNGLRYEMREGLLWDPKGRAARDAGYQPPAETWPEKCVLLRRLQLLSYNKLIETRQP